MTTQECIKIFNSYRFSNHEFKNLIPEVKEQLAIWFANKITSEGKVYLNEVFDKRDELLTEYWDSKGITFFLEDKPDWINFVEEP